MTAEIPKQQIHVYFAGKVQGVGFRAVAQRFAQEMHLKGVVRNLPNGTVELIAQGSKEQLIQLVNRLETFFQLESSLTRLAWEEASLSYPDFRVI